MKSFADGARSFILTVSRQCGQKMFDLDIAAFAALAPDIIHFPAYLFEVVQGVGIFCKDFVAIVFYAQMCQIDQPCGRGTADPLFHGFGRITEPSAQVVQAEIIR